MNRTTWTAAPLVFVSGACALIYQIVWTREFRLIFGASTAASAAVVAIFIAGLGAGGWVLGRRVEQSTQPLRFYAELELGIAALSALTPWLLPAARTLYIATGGSLRFGSGVATVLRLLLALAVIGLPTFLMGGTLPAVARAAESDQSADRRSVALLYGVNTLGAVVGCLLANFAMLEVFGARLTLWIACLLNALIGITGRSLARKQPEVPLSSTAQPGAGVQLAAAAPTPLVLGSAALVGLAFFLMELVWYRLLGPLLGGTIFTFGLILAVALLGIGLGSAVYAFWLSKRRASLAGFALSCALEAACMAVPWALGDNLALWALQLRPLGNLGFFGLLAGWTFIAACVVFPAAFVAGVQFPLLIALLGSGRAHVGRDVGATYAANTLGAIAGALGGGFGLLPMFGALGCFRFVSYLLAGWAALCGVLALLWQTPSDTIGRWGRPLSLALVLGLSILLLQARGPTAGFRHSPIGAGRVPPNTIDSPNGARAFLANQRHAIGWEKDGRESALALDNSSGLSFIVNGKNDGNARLDAPTQAMSGLIGAALLPRVRSAMVIGLGTGSTAGWLAALPEIERVDVAEIEPAIIEVAKRSASVNERALENPKLHVFTGDARELLAVSRAQYDVIFSEPSNPYRAGIASLYTHEFYEAVAERLSSGGIFVQWLQAYEIDAQTVQMIYATLRSVFPHVETWNGLPRDLLLVVSRNPPVHDVAALRERLAQPLFARAMHSVWRTHGVEGLFSHYVANADFAAALSDKAAEVALNTDDLSPVEFGFGRGLGTSQSRTADALYASVRKHGADRPRLRNGTVDFARVDFESESASIAQGFPGHPDRLTPEYRARFDVLRAWAKGNQGEALAAMRRLPASVRAEPSAIEVVVNAELLAHAADPEAEAALALLTPQQPTEAVALRAVYAQRTGRVAEAHALWLELLQRSEHDPWPMMQTIQRALGALQPATAEAARELVARLGRPFAVRVNEQARERTRLRLVRGLGSADRACLDVMAALEPDVPWNEEFLKFRLACYMAHDSPQRAIAEQDLRTFWEATPVGFENLLQ